MAPRKSPYSAGFICRCTPIIATMVILLFLGVWNDMLWPPLILKSVAKYTIQIDWPCLRITTVLTNSHPLLWRPRLRASFRLSSFICSCALYYREHCAIWYQAIIQNKAKFMRGVDVMKKLPLIPSFVLVFTLAACSGSSGKDVTGGVTIEKYRIWKERFALRWQAGLDNGIDALTGNPTIGLNEYLDKTFKNVSEHQAGGLSDSLGERKAKQTAMLLRRCGCLVYRGAFASQWYQEGLLRDLDDLIEKDTSFDPSIYLEGIMNNSYSTKSPDGSKQFGIPAVLGRRMTIYDKKLFEDWGVETLGTARTGRNSGESYK